MSWASLHPIPIHLSATAIYLLSMMVHVTINYDIGTPGYGKDIMVDALNDVDKEFLQKMMCQIAVLDKDQTTIGQEKNSVPCIVNKKEEVVSHAEEAARLCALEQSEGAKGRKEQEKEGLDGLHCLFWIPKW
jgi:hypothetical protein